MLCQGNGHWCLPRLFWAQMSCFQPCSAGLNTKALGKHFSWSGWGAFFIVSIKGRDCLAQTTGLSKPCGFCLVAVCLGRALLSCLTLQAPPSLSTAHNHLCVPCVDCPCPGEEGACSLLVLYNPLGCCKRRGGDYTAAIQLSMNPYYLLAPCWK